ncbi:MAG: 16S rRNA processing protein RimM [Oscillospiraceae bacterium]|nr:16S rRNA processing protein RimM [Oscillospiraceae bacterium]
MKSEYITVGTVVNAHGIRGEVKVNPAGVEPFFIAKCKKLNIGGKETAVRSARVHKSAVLLTLPGVEDMDAALALKGQEVSVRRADVQLPAGEYFDAELEGLTVLDDATGETLGTLDRVLHYPAHKIYQVRGGGREYLIPAVPEVFIASVDVDGGVMRIHRMKGLAGDEN